MCGILRIFVSKPEAEILKDYNLVQGNFVKTIQLYIFQLNPIKFLLSFSKRQN